MPVSQFEEHDNADGLAKNFGPYATVDGRLNDDGRQFLEDWLAEWPVASKLFSKAFPNFSSLAARCGMECAEIEELCLLGAVRAALHYDPRLGMFSTYAGYWMRSMVSRHLRAQSRYTRRTSSSISDGHSFPTRIINFTELDIWDVNEQGSDLAIDAEETSFLNRRILTALELYVPSRRNREIYMKRHGLSDGVPRTLEAVGIEYGLTRERVRQIVMRVNAIIRLPLERLYMGIWGETVTHREIGK